MDVTSRSVVIAALAAFCGRAIAQTSAPPQIQPVSFNNFIPGTWSGLVPLSKITNNGTASTIVPRLTQRRSGPPDNTVFQAFAYDVVSGGIGYTQLNVPSGANDSGAFAGTFGGKYAGNSNPSNQGVMPVYWESSTVWTRSFNSAFEYGIFLDINATGRCAGYYQNFSGVRTGCYLDTSFTTLSGWTAVSPYVNQESNSAHYRKVKARFGADRSIGSFSAWRIGFEQARILVDP